MHHLDKETFVTAVSGRRDCYVPLHTTDIVQYLAQHPQLKQDQQRFRTLASLILALLHHLYRQRHEQLTYIYAPLDPDCDRMLISVPTCASRHLLCEELYLRLEDALERANYRQLNLPEIQAALQAASHWGVRMRVNFAGLQKLEVYARGSVLGKRSIRSWRRYFKLQTIEVPLYQRLVVVFRTAEGHLSPQFDAQRVYLRMFKNVPQQDIDMMLPAAGVHMSWLDHSKIVVPSLYAAAITLWRVARNVVILAFFGVFKTIGMVLLVLFAIGFGLKSMFTYRDNTKRRYLLNMAQSLYFQNLDNNAGVLLRLLEEGEQQEACEAVLAYYVMVFHLGGDRPHHSAEIGHACEELLREMTGLAVRFDIEATLRNLVHLGIVRTAPAGWTGLPLSQATMKLDRTWDSWFNA